jgi:septation ring formation regulator EzrA
MKIIINIKPFLFAQSITVVNDDNKIITEVNSSMKMLAENISELITRYNCNEIKIKGNKTFTQKTIKDIQTCYLTKYNKKLDIKIEQI